MRPGSRDKKTPPPILSMADVRRQSARRVITETKRDWKDDGYKPPLDPRLTDGMWEGRPCYIVGGGPSLSGFDWGLLEDKLSIGINRAYEFFTPTIIFLMDRRFWQWIQEDTYGAEAKERFNNFNGLKCILDVDRERMPDSAGFIEIRRHPKTSAGWGNSLEEGLGDGNNSGFAALNLAAILGADPIYLLGYDMHVQNPRAKQQWFHTGHHSKFIQTQHVYATFIDYFKKVAEPNLKDRQVVNLNTDSNLKCFPRKTWKEAHNE